MISRCYQCAHKNVCKQYEDFIEKGIDGCDEFLPETDKQALETNPHYSAEAEALKQQFAGKQPLLFKSGDLDQC